MKFEDRITESAQRMVTEQNANLHVPANPLKHNHSYWGWIATPAAAIIGIVFGLSYQNFTEKSSELIAHTVDTIFVPQVQHDTLWLTRVEEKEHVVEKTVWRERKPLTRQVTSTQTSTHDNIKKEDPTCTSVSCDGINYAILASN